MQLRQWLINSAWLHLFLFGHRFLFGRLLFFRIVPFPRCGAWFHMISNDFNAGASTLKTKGDLGVSARFLNVKTTSTYFQIAVQWRADEKMRNFHISTQVNYSRNGFHNTTTVGYFKDPYPRS